MIRQCKSASGDGWLTNKKQSNRLSVYLWQDNRPVIIVSTNCDPSLSTQVQRRQKNGTTLSVPCPLSVQLYNKYMGGVDRNDQLRGYYSVRLKGRKCYKYMWWFIFDVAVTNCYILSRHHSNSTAKTVKDFRANLAKDLIGNFNNRKRRGRPSSTRTSLSSSSSFSTDHFPKRSEKRKRCHYCYHYRQHERHESHWYCSTCENHFCHNGKPDDCFLLFHTQVTQQMPQ